MNKDFRNYISGAIAGTCDTIINYPPYCLHYRFQRRENMYSTKIYYPRELYRGIFAYSAIIPITCICDGMTNWFKFKGVEGYLAAIYSGMIAATIVSAPIGNSIVTNLRLKEEGKEAGTVKSIKHLINNYGLFNGFYIGIIPLMAREGIYSWSVFYAKREVQNRYNYGDIKASIVSGTIASILSQPCDTLATFMQNKVIRNNISTLACISQMYQINGIRGFYRGFFFRWYAIVAGVFVMDKASTESKKYL